MSGAPTLNAGFIPLIDAAPLLVAERLGLAAAEGVTLNLSRETSWATIRDRLSVNHLDVAHALAPLPLAANLGLGPMDARMIVPICFGTGGNTVTVATHVAEAIRQAEGASAPAAMSAGTSAPFDPSAAVAGLKRLVRERDAAGLRKLVFGIVHPHSAHRYQLAYWLASGGIVPGRDISLLVLPPALLPSALEAGRIDGFCAGEPWGSTAVASSAGTILTTNAHIWRGSPEKVLAVNAEWAEPNRDALLRLVRAIYRACLWCDDAENHGALADLLAGDDAVGTPRALIANSLARTLPASSDTKVAV
ncbi:MAG: CmpA/NrtA family ABC transporter substrate-binding protein, partial [Pseudomonadota bacterium]